MTVIANGVVRHGCLNGVKYAKFSSEHSNVVGSTETDRQNEAEAIMCEYFSPFVDGAQKEETRACACNNVRS